MPLLQLNFQLTGNEETKNLHMTSMQNSIINCLNYI